MRRAAVVAGVAAVCFVPGTASADVLFDPADADELAATLQEAYEAQDVCYGWHVTINNVGMVDDSIGSNFGAGRSVDDSACDASVEFTATITWTSEASESEDSGSYSVVTTGGDRPTTADLDSLELISVEGLIGDNGDMEVYKAVSALPLLAADAGLADPIEATPAPETAAGPDAQPTNSPGSDFWRDNGMLVLWGSVLLLAGAVFAWWVVRSDRRRVIYRGNRSSRTGGAVLAEPEPRDGPPEEQTPVYVPEEWSRPADDPAGKRSTQDPESPPEPTSEDDPDTTDEGPPEASSPDEPPRPKS